MKGATVKFCFEDLEVWKRAVSFTVDIRKTTNGFPIQEQYGLVSQLNRAASSVAMNIAEGAGRYHNLDFIRFVRIARGSLYEVVTALKICMLSDIISKDQYVRLYQEANEIGRMLNGLAIKLKTSTYKV